MRTRSRFVITALLALSLPVTALAQSHATSMQRLDTNHDGAVDATEAGPSIWPGLRQADANGDGRVTRAELQATHRSMTTVKR
jgi:hypothetical protein